MSLKNRCKETADLSQGKPPSQHYLAGIGGKTMKNMSWQLVSLHKAETKTSRTRSGRAEQLNSNVWLKESLTA
jgi:hypothetical protein